MKQEEISDALNYLEEDLTAPVAAARLRERRKKHAALWGTLAACLVLAVTAFTLGRYYDRGVEENANLSAPEFAVADGESSLDGNDYSAGDGPAQPVYSVGVDFRELDGPPAADKIGQSEACLGWLEPEELFAMDTVIFRGIVRNIRYFQAKGGYDAYFSVAAVEILETYRGDLAVGDVYNIYLPVIPGTMTNSVAGGLDELTVGSEAIFMPYVATPESGWRSENVFFCYADVAELWFSEGERFLFLQTQDGVSYAEDVYDIPHDGEQVSLEDVAEYIRGMLR